MTVQNTMTELAKQCKGVSWAGLSARIESGLVGRVRQELLFSVCPDCGALTHRQEACEFCRNCGWSAC